MDHFEASGEVFQQPVRRLGGSSE